MLFLSNMIHDDNFMLYFTLGVIVSLISAGIDNIIHRTILDTLWRVVLDGFFYAFIINIGNYYLGARKTFGILKIIGCLSVIIISIRFVLKIIPTDY